MGVLIGVCFGVFIAWIVAVWYRISISDSFKDDFMEIFEDEDDERMEECEDGGEADDADK